MFVIYILLFISLLLHAVAFYFILVLFMKNSTIKELKETQEKMLKEAESAITGFLIELKDENEKLIRELKLESKKTNTEQLKNSNSEINRNNSTGSREQPGKKRVTSDQEVPAYLAELTEVEDIIKIKNLPGKNTSSPENEAIRLYQTGHTVEQIAKILQKGKTEIELLLEFRGK